MIVLFYIRLIILLVSLSPTDACLNRAYTSSSSSLLGVWLRFLTSSAACLKAWKAKTVIINVKYIILLSKKQHLFSMLNTVKQEKWGWGTTTTPPPPISIFHTFQQKKKSDLCWGYYPWMVFFFFFLGNIGNLPE